jgi:hypothetical protein
MHSETRVRLRRIITPTSNAEGGVTGVTQNITQPDHTQSHLLSHPTRGAETVAQQGVTPVTPVTRAGSDGNGERHTAERVTESQRVRMADLVPASDWVEYFEERAAIREYEGGFSRSVAERLAWADTIAALGTPPRAISAVRLVAIPRPHLRLIKDEDQ